MKTKSPKIKKTSARANSTELTQPDQSLPSASVSQLWRQLRETPAALALWQALAHTYAGQGLPWHMAYAAMQARRCGAAQQASATAMPGMENLQADAAASQAWGDSTTTLTHSGVPGPALAHALTQLEATTQAEPGDWLSWLYLARCRELLQSSAPGTSPAVRSAVLQALGCEPIAGETGHLLAQWRLRAGQPGQALAALQAVLLQAPQRYGSWLLQAQAQMQLGQETAARVSFQTAGESKSPDLLALLAEKLFIFNFGQESLAVRQAIVGLRPQEPRHWLALAEIQAKLWQIDNAQASVAQALTLEPDNVLALRWREDLTAAGYSRPQFERDLARYEAQGLRENAQGATRLLMQSLYQSHLTGDEVASLHRRVGQAMTEQALSALGADLPPSASDPLAGRRLRVGYVTGDLHRQHPVNVFMLPVLMRHDHSVVEVFIYQTGTMIDEYTRQARACADHWREAAHLNDLALRQMIVDDRVDVLVDLAGHTATHRLGVFATRPAPVQMSYLGYPHSTGLPCMDWMIADAVVAPPEHDHLFTERVARVTGSVFCWAPVDEYPLPAETQAQSMTPPSGPVVFASFNNLLKVDDATLAVWARVLRECPDSKLLLKSAVLADPVVVAQTRQRFEAEGVAPDRLILRGPSELSLMMQEYLDVDIALDPFPYNGGTTSLQALWMGCPLVALEGSNFVSRMGASFLTHLGRTEWLASDADDYVVKARALANAMRIKPWSRQAQRAAMQVSRLCDIERHTREIEGIYQQAMVTHVETLELQAAY